MFIIEMEDTNKNNKEPQKWVEETKSGFVKGIVEAFDGFVHTFKHNGLLYVTFILVLFMILYSFILNPININEIVTNALKQEDQIKKEQLERSIEQRIEADRMINQVGNDVIDQFNGINRVMVFETHDGSQSLSNLEYTFASCTAEIINTNNIKGEEVYDIDYQADNFQKNHLANLFGQESWQRMKHEKYLYFPNLDNYHRTTYRFINKMKTICGSRSLIIVPFLSNNIPMVILVISSREDEMPAQQIYNYIERFRPQIEKYLMSIL